MSSVLWLVILWAVVAYVETRMTWHNMGAPFNGLGAIPAVLRGDALLPMQRRVLVPWLWFALGGWRIADVRSPQGLRLYLAIKTVLVGFALSSAWLWFGSLGLDAKIATSMLAVWFCASALFDYPDAYAEMGLFSLAFLLIGRDGAVGFWWLALVCTLAGLNRETAIMLPVVAVLATGASLTAVAASAGAVLGVSIPTVLYPGRKRYCAFLQVRANLRELAAWAKTGNKYVVNEWYLFFGLAVIGSWLYGRGLILGALGPVSCGMAVLTGAMLLCGKWREIRIFGPTVLALIPMALGRAV